MSSADKLSLFNCSTSGIPISSFQQNCSSPFGCSTTSSQIHERSSTCLFINDFKQLGVGFHPKDLNCTHYSRLYRSASSFAAEGFQLGTRISFEIPDHAHNLCDKGSKPNGNCGVGMRCICHPKECKDKVLSAGVDLKPSRILLYRLMLFIVLIGF